MEIKDLNAFKVGDPAKINYAGATIYGNIELIQGGIITLRTPGGSQITSGRIWVTVLTLEEDLEKLRHFEKLAANQEPVES